MKKFLIPALVLIMLLASFTPALAGNGIRLKGYITVIDENAQTFTLLVRWGSEYVGQEIAVQVTDRTTLCEYNDSKTCTVISFVDLEVDDRVGITGSFVGDIFIARKVVVH